MKRSTLSEKSHLRGALDDINKEAWPAFMLNWECKEWAHLYSTFADYQILLLTDDDDIMAYGHTIPIYWDESLELIPDDLATIIKRAVRTHNHNKKPNLLVALAAVVSDNHKGKGLSYEVVKAMKDMALAHDILDVMIPVRPTLKSKYPLIPLKQYTLWENDEKTSFDPWLRVHRKLGGKVLKTAEKSITITGCISQWESWTNTRIPGSGEYVFEGTLNSVLIDTKKDIGIYNDPCVWMYYSLVE